MNGQSVPIHDKGYRPSIANENEKAIRLPPPIEVSREWHVNTKALNCHAQTCGFARAHSFPLRLLSRSGLTREPLIPAWIQLLSAGVMSENCWMAAITLHAKPELHPTRFHWQTNLADRILHRFQGKAIFITPGARRANGARCWCGMPRQKMVLSPNRQPFIANLSKALMFSQ